MQRVQNQTEDLFPVSHAAGHGEFIAAGADLVTHRNMGTVLHIYTAPTRGAPMVAQAAVTAVAGQGLMGDRYEIRKNRRKVDFHLTLIEMENIEAYIEAVDGAFTPDMPRRNIVTRGIALNELCGTRFRVGDVLCEGIELCEPCSLFARRTRREVLKFFLHRGGLLARILVGGEIRVGDLTHSA
jgi:MOSC domain-containing protein YiiM